MYFKHLFIYLYIYYHYTENKQFKKTKQRKPIFQSYVNFLYLIYMYSTCNGILTEIKMFM